MSVCPLAQRGAHGGTVMADAWTEDVEAASQIPYLGYFIGFIWHPTTRLLPFPLLFLRDVATI